MNAPTVLTTLRIVSIPILVVVLLSQFNNKAIFAFAIFLLASLTDTFDGLWARKKNKITVLGQLLDPIADKLLITAALICLVELGSLPSWVAILIIGREIAVTGLRAIASSRGHIISASRLGKMKMTLETIAVSMLILGKGILGALYFLSQIALWLAVAVAVISGIEYFIKFAPFLLSRRT
ncbi:MAG: CDP-diacylglycerol--glycerol-3-phosphate 3-phosphatidyltransferase [Candidatus Aminicenantales bacterium]